MRKLKTSDMFALGRCISKIGVKEDLKQIAMEASSAKDIYEKGFDILFLLFEKVCATSSERHIYEFIGTLFECDWKEVEEMNPLDLIEKLKEVANVEEWKRFFKTAASLMK